ncbi:hypothetical protein IEI92_17945 [Microbispora bryophytorum]|nr:hypothetical protein [Microbispora bryophytorum]
MVPGSAVGNGASPAARPPLAGEFGQVGVGQPRSPTTIGKVERFHQTLRRELLDDAVPFEDFLDLMLGSDWRVLRMKAWPPAWPSCSDHGRW